MEPISRPKLPTYGNKDGDQILDSAGNIYEYNLEEKEWIYKGLIPEPETVNYSRDGLLPPGIFRKLSLVQELIGQGYDFSKFKLGSQVSNPYYYLFYSSDDLIRFYPEKITEPREVKGTGIVVELGDQDDKTYVKIAGPGINFAAKSLVGLKAEVAFGSFLIVDNSIDVLVLDQLTNIAIGDDLKIVKPELIKSQLKIEVDRGRLYQKLVRNCCVGPKGKQGNAGDTGSDGTPADDEVFQAPINLTSGRFEWDTVVNTPIDTPISLRIYQSEDAATHSIEIVYSLSTGDIVVTTDNTIDIEETTLSVIFEPTTNRFSGSVHIIQGGESSSTWKYKARQKGPKGPAGTDGKAFFQIVSQLLDDPTIRSTEALISMRKAVASDDVVILRNPLFENLPTANLAATDGDSISDIADELFVSAKVTVREAKDLGKFVFAPKDTTIPELDFPAWTPTKDCVQSRRWSQYKFDWFDQVSPKYLYQMIPTPKPPEACCAEDFFFCPNLGDTPCKIEGTIDPPIPIPVPCECECENPLSGQFFGGGLVLNPIDLLSVEFATGEETVEEHLSLFVAENPDALIPSSSVKASGINIAESVIDGTEQTFIQNISLVGNGEIRVIMEYDADICGGETLERKNKQFVDSDALSSIIMLTDKAKVSDISNDGIWETKTIPVGVIFTVTTHKHVLPDVPPTTEPGFVAIPYETGMEVPTEVTNPQAETASYDIADLELSIKINATLLNYCRGYRLTVIAKSDRTAITTSKTYLVVPQDGQELIVQAESGSEIDIPTTGTSITGSGPEDVPFVPEESFASTADIISSVVPVQAVIDGAIYSLRFPLTGGASLSGVSDTKFLVNLYQSGRGELTKTPKPSQTPLHQDNLNFNASVDLNQLEFYNVDGGYSANGPFGPGTYVLGGNFTSQYQSVMPPIDVRLDRWTNSIIYIKEPQSALDDQTVTIVARVDGSELYNIANSVFMESLFQSELSEGIIVITLSNPQSDPMAAIKNGEIVLFDNAMVNIGYYGSNVADYFPEVLIDSVGSDGSDGSG